MEGEVLHPYGSNAVSIQGWDGGGEVLVTDCQGKVLLSLPEYVVECVLDLAGQAAVLVIPGATPEHLVFSKPWFYQSSSVPHLEFTTGVWEQ